MESGQEWPDIFLVCQLSCVPRCMYVYVYIIIMYIYIGTYVEVHRSQSFS